jgi:hypothetical protein
MLLALGIKRNVTKLPFLFSGSVGPLFNMFSCFNRKLAMLCHSEVKSEKNQATEKKKREEKLRGSEWKRKRSILKTRSLPIFQATFTPKMCAE